MNPSRIGCACLLLVSLAQLPAAEVTTSSAPGEREFSNNPLSPSQALASFKTEPGVRVELVACEPITIDPVAVAFDERGRMFVVEDRGYPIGPPAGEPPAGVVAMLEDTHGDGVYDKRTVLVDGLTFPNGIACWRGGVFVTCAPNIYYFKDTRGTGRADVRKVVLTGFDDKTTTQLRVSHPTLGLDGWIYLTSGLTGGKVTSPEHPERPRIEFKRSDSRFRPDTLEFETVAGAGQFGLTFDPFGRRFVCSNRNPLQHIVVETHYLKRNPYLPDSESVQDVAPFGAEAKVWPISPDTTTASFMPELMSAPHAGTFTSACGCLIYPGALFGPDFAGNAFICEPAQNLVQRQVLSPAGATFHSGAAHPGLDFLTSPDTWFRPVFAAQGPEEALYICDMYRKVIDHPEYLPEAVRTQVDFNAGKDKGRIYRVLPEGASPQEMAAARKPRLNSLDTQKLCQALSNSNSWFRATAFRLLLERNDQSGMAALKLIVNNPRSLPQARVAALRLLDCAGQLTSETLQLALADQNAAVREQAVQLAEPRLANSDDLFRRIASLSQDPDPRVRFQCALALGETRGPVTINRLAAIARRDGTDRWTRLAVLASVGKDIEEFFKDLISGTPGSPDAMGLVMTDLSYMFGLSEPAQACLEFLTKITELPDKAEPTWQPAALNGMAEALRSRGLTKTGLSPLRSLVSGDSDQARLGASRFENLVRQVTKMAAEPSVSLAARQTAIRFVGEAGGDGSETFLLNLIAPGEPTEIQAAAARAYGRLHESSWGKPLVTRQRWRAYLPPVREAVLSVLFSEPGFIKTLLDSLEHQDIQVWSIEPARRNQLMRHKDENIRKRALALFKNAAGADRQKVYEDYKSVLKLPANPDNGHEVFKRICAQCHTCRGQGVAVGPDLSGVHNQPAEALLLHILIPSYEIVPGYTSYEVETKDGGTFSGLISSETATTISLKRALGATDSILRTNIAAITSSGLSLMPDELEKTMTRQELADVIGFLREH